MYNLLIILTENRIQVFSVIGSISLVLIILSLIKRKNLKEEYSLLWLGFGCVFVLISIFKPLLQILASALGIIYAPSALLLMLIVSSFFILIQFSVVISKLSESNKNLIQEVGILKVELKKLKSPVQDKK
jgi:hypothetical protein